MTWKRTADVNIDPQSGTLLNDVPSMQRRTSAQRNPLNSCVFQWKGLVMSCRLLCLMLWD